MNMSKLNKKNLDSQGYVVLPFADTKQLLKLQKDYHKTLDNFIEYKKVKTCKQKGFVLGGFSALANPSSFHNKFVRKLRQWCMSHLIQTLFCEYPEYCLEQIIDRMMYRPKGFKPSTESWHRDEAPNAQNGDKTFGGWINLDSTNQYFSAVPKTHKQVSGHKGFALIKSKEEKEEYNKNKFKIVIPPGHILVFYENMVHEVLSKKSKKPIQRVFLAWRLTRFNEPYFPNIKLLLKTQSVMPLKSLQIPPVYAKLHWTNWRGKIEEFSKNIKDECKEVKTMGSGKDKGKKYHIVRRFLPSLSELNKTLIPYSKDELRMYTPNYKWTLLEPFKSRIYKKYCM